MSKHTHTLTTNTTNTTKPFIPKSFTYFLLQMDFCVFRQRGRRCSFQKPRSLTPKYPMNHWREPSHPDEWQLSRSGWILWFSRFFGCPQLRACVIRIIMFPRFPRFHIRRRHRADIKQDPHSGSLTWGWCRLRALSNNARIPFHISLFIVTDPPLIRFAFFSIMIMPLLEIATFQMYRVLKINASREMERN